MLQIWVTFYLHRIRLFFIFQFNDFPCYTPSQSYINTRTHKCTTHIKITRVGNTHTHTFILNLYFCNVTRSIIYYYIGILKNRTLRENISEGHL